MTKITETIELIEPNATIKNKNLDNNNHATKFEINFQPSKPTP